MMNKLYYRKGKYYTNYLDAISGMPSLEFGSVKNPFEMKWKRFSMLALPGNVVEITKMP